MMKLRTHGFTVVEALIALTVTTALILIISSFLTENMLQSTLANAKQDILRETQQSLDAAANDIRLSANADEHNRWSDTNSPSGSTNPYSWTSNSTTLVLATAAENTSGNIIFSDSHNYITEKNNLVYFVSNGTLYKRTIAANVTSNAAKTSCPANLASSSCPADKALLHNVTEFSLIYMDGDDQVVQPTNARSIKLTVKVNKKLYSRTVSADYTTRMVFRND